ncbi:MAG TPA: Gfo/Idh/MocA family oxidoreductase [Phycisphaerae bacterium]|nr:Gfo/Idh/MocA family oxidoreductase [Phycisphaerae bacterium]
MPDVVRYGLISAGRMAGYTMLQIMRGHPAARPVAWYEMNPDRPDTAQRIVQLRQAGLESCDSLEALLARQDVDVILNVTPHYAHAETSLAALRAGRYVICEKPPAVTQADCDAMVDASGRAGGRLLVHFQHLLRPTARWLNQAICRGELGRIRRVRGISLWWREPDYFRRVDWAGKRAYQGKTALDGALCNQTVHYLNQMLALAQRTAESHVGRPRTMRAALYRFHDERLLEMEDTAVATGVLDNDDETEFLFAGTIAAAGAAGTSRGAEYAGLPERHHIVIEGERGWASWGGRAELHVQGREPEIREVSEPHWPFYFHVQRVLAGEEQPVTPIEQSVNTMRFIFATYQAVHDRIRQCPWDRNVEVADVLHRCNDAFCLPAELDRAPDWA